MEIVIVVSVLITLSVVALIALIVVIFNKLSKKVDVNDYEREFENQWKVSDQRFNEANLRIDEVLNITNQEMAEIKRIVDSRCDKLYSQIEEVKKK